MGHLEGGVVSSGPLNLEGGVVSSGHLVGGVVSSGPLRAPARLADRLRQADSGGRQLADRLRQRPQVPASPNTLTRTLSP